MVHDLKPNCSYTTYNTKKLMPVIYATKPIQFNTAEQTTGQIK